MKQFITTICILTAIQLSLKSYGQNLVAGGTMDDASKWIQIIYVVDAGLTQSTTFNYTTTLPTGGTGGCLRLRGQGSATGSIKCGLTQQITLKKNTYYKADFRFKDLSSKLVWAWFNLSILANKPSAIAADANKGEFCGFSGWANPPCGQGVDGLLSELGCLSPNSIIKLGNTPGDTTVWLTLQYGNYGQTIPYEVLIDDISLTAQQPVSAITVSGLGGSPIITTNKGTLQMLADVAPADAANKNVSWSVTNGTGTATISSDGLLTAQSNGKVTVKATAKDGSNVIGQLDVTITNQEVPVTSIQLKSYGNITGIAVNSNLQILYTILPDNANDKTVSWKVINGAGTASIDTEGLLTGLSAGTITVEALANDGSGVKGQLALTIYDNIIPVTSVSITNTSAEINTNGGIMHMTAVVNPANATIKDIKWSVTNGTGEAAINENGLLSAKSNGTVIVKASAIDGSCISDEKLITIIGQGPFNIVQHLLDTDQGSAGEAFAYGVPADWDWASKATLNSLSAAQPNNYANYWGAVFRGSTNKTPVNTEVEISKTSMWVLYNGATEWVEFQNQSVPLGGGNFTPTYGNTTQWNQLVRNTQEGSFVIPATDQIWHFWNGSSFKLIQDNIREIIVNTQTRLVLNNPNEIDDRDQADYLIHVGADKRNNTGSCPNGICASFGVGKFMRVTKDWRNVTFHSITQSDIDNGMPLPPASIFELPSYFELLGLTVSAASTSIAVGTATQVKATITPENASFKSVVWSSSNQDVASVNNKGIVSALSQGLATITATAQDGGKTASIEISVSAFSPSENLALYKPTNYSSVYNYNNFGSFGVDADAATKYSSVFSDPQWFYVDLGGNYDITRVKIYWDAAFGKAYKIQVSSNGSVWTDIYSITTGDGDIDDLTGLSGTGRYVRIYGTVRGSKFPDLYGYSFNELEVYGKIISTAGVDETEFQNIKIFPNPVIDKLYVKRSENTPMKILIHDMCGKLMLSINSNQSQDSINFNRFKPGLYTVELHIGKQIRSYKVTKQ